MPQSTTNNTQNPSEILAEIKRTLNLHESDFNGEKDLFDLLPERKRRIESVIDMLSSKVDEGNIDIETVRIINLLKESWMQLAICLDVIEDENDTLKNIAFKGKLPPKELRN